LRRAVRLVCCSWPAKVAGGSCSCARSLLPGGACSPASLAVRCVVVFFPFWPPCWRVQGGPARHLSPWRRGLPLELFSSGLSVTCLVIPLDSMVVGPPLHLLAGSVEVSSCCPSPSDAVPGAGVVAIDRDHRNPRGGRQRT
jgi:hypothetical protein